MFSNFSSIYSFITFRSARHLDGKHTVFGRIVGGLDALDKLEKVKTDKQDKPEVWCISILSLSEYILGNYIVRNYEFQVLWSSSNVYRKN